MLPFADHCKLRTPGLAVCAATALYSAIDFAGLMLQMVAQINGSLARAAMKELLEKGQIKAVAQHSKQQIYTRAIAAA